MGEAGAKLLAITYYYIRSRVLKSPRRFLEQLAKEGLIESVERLPMAEREVLEQMFREATALSDAGQLPYGKQIYEQLSERARAAFPAESESVRRTRESARQKR